MINKHILLRKNIPARSVKRAMEIIKGKYPNAKLISYKRNKPYIKDNNKMNVLFIRDTSELRRFL